MPFFEHNTARIHYETRGNGPALLLIAPGGMRSTIEAWERAPWNPLAEFSDQFQVIAMDQRNAGQSTGPISGDDGWHTYRDDQLALMDHLGIDQFQTLGMCIGGPYCMGLIEAAPERVRSAVILQTIGRSADNQAAFDQLFEGWAEGLRAQHPELTDQDWARFRNNMFGGDFLYNVSRDFVRQCQTPLLVLMGNDLYHPEAVSRELAELAPAAELIEYWKEPEHRQQGIETARAFLQRHAS